ncbi:hypothetical protein [Streptomyces mangrovisoli]|uniref:Uncharacterized protein n=1 Tax=Streptomyces mangrovisoli TaxID=1428628 RepID=A0A1J4NNL5_9ACTN|nr:hypothetical protein [Streptomyces mangrovisoli]OIJ63943.1 hypothetical protein WN71_031590 [Streptomyces mangrovisoli]
MSAELVGQAVTVISAATTAYGARVLTQSEELAAQGTVRLGQRLVARLLRRGRHTAVESAVRDLAEAAPEEREDARAALRLHLGRALREDPELRAELASLLAGGAHAQGAGAVVVSGSNEGIVSTGDNAINIQRRD